MSNQMASSMYDHDNLQGQEQSMREQDYVANAPNRSLEELVINLNTAIDGMWNDTDCPKPNWQKGSKHEAGITTAQRAINSWLSVHKAKS